MTPADELLAAADRLDALLAATSDFPAPWMVALHGGVYAAAGCGEWVAEGCGDLEPYIAAMDPGVGRALAYVLRKRAKHPSRIQADLTDLARAINGQAP